MKKTSQKSIKKKFILYINCRKEDQENGREKEKRRKICDCLITPNSCLFLAFFISDDEAIEHQTAQLGNFPPRYLSRKFEFFVLWALFAVFLGGLSECKLFTEVCYFL